jgi:hypothetical protein
LWGLLDSFQFTPHDPAIAKDIISAIKSCGKELSATEEGGNSSNLGQGILIQFPKGSKEIRSVLCLANSRFVSVLLLMRAWSCFSDQLIKLAKTKAEDTRTRIKRIHSEARNQLKRIEGMGKDDVYKVSRPSPVPYLGFGLERVWWVFVAGPRHSKGNRRSE